MSTAPQQDLLLSSTQPQPVVSNVLTSVCIQPSSETLTLSSYPCVSTRDQPLDSPTICSSGGPTPLPTVCGTATSEVPHFSGYTLPPSACSIASGHSTTHVSPASLAGALPTASLSPNSTFLESFRTPAASFPHRATIPGVGKFTSEQLQAISAWLQPGLWSRKTRHPTPTPGNFDYPTPTPTPTPDRLRPSAVLVT